MPMLDRSQSLLILKKKLWEDMSDRKQGWLGPSQKSFLPPPPETLELILKAEDNICLLGHRGS